MKNRTVSFILLFFLILFPLSSSAGAEAPSAPSYSYQYDEQGRLEAVTAESVFDDGTRMVTVTLMDPVLQLPVSEDTVVSSLDGSRETINVTYTRDMFGTILSQSTVTVERDGSEIKDLITNNSYGSNTYRKTEAYDPQGTLIMSEESSYVYTPDNVLMSSRQNSFQQNGHDITTVTTYDSSGVPLEATTDYSLADGSTGSRTLVYSTPPSDDAVPASDLPSPDAQPSLSDVSVSPPAEPDPASSSPELSESEPDSPPPEPAESSESVPEASSPEASAEAASSI